MVAEQAKQTRGQDTGNTPPPHPLPFPMSVLKWEIVLVSKSLDIGLLKSWVISPWMKRRGIPSSRAGFAFLGVLPGHSLRPMCPYEKRACSEKAVLESSRQAPARRHCGNTGFDRMPIRDQRRREEVTVRLREMAQRLSLQGGNRFRARAYETAADNLALITKPLGEVIAAGELTTIPGIGRAIAATVERLYRTGEDPALGQLRKDLPEGVLHILSIPGLRANQVLRLYQETGISSVEELRRAIEDGSLKTSKALTPAFQRKLSQGLTLRREVDRKQHLHRAAANLEAAKHNLSLTHPHLHTVTIAGDVRRQCELVEDLSLVAISDRPQAAAPVLAPIRLYLCREQTFASTLLLATGSTGHIASLKARARTMKLTLTAKGLKRAGRVIPTDSEAHIYKALGLAFIPPELREGLGEIERAQQTLPPRLVTREHIQGILHAHTVRSDGADTLKDMADATKARGFSYLGITDHSQSATYAGGMKAPEVFDQMNEADAINAGYGERFHIFKGIESDILPDGALDYPETVLKRFDFVIASIHSRFNLDRDAQTRRILHAISNPYTTILGHVTGRQLLRRPGYDLDMETILKACARFRVAVEINAHPWRLDLDWRWHQMA